MSGSMSPQKWVSPGWGWNIGVQVLRVGANVLNEKTADKGGVLQVEG